MNRRLILAAVALTLTACTGSSADTAAPATTTTVAPATTTTTDARQAWAAAHGPDVIDFLEFVERRSAVAASLPSNSTTAITQWCRDTADELVAEYDQQSPFYRAVEQAPADMRIPLATMSSGYAETLMYCLSGDWDAMVDSMAGVLDAMTTLQLTFNTAG